MGVINFAPIPKAYFKARISRTAARWKRWTSVEGLDLFPRPPRRTEAGEEAQ